jgi:hypothetical protein
VLPESWSFGLNANLQMRAGFRGKGNKIYYLSDEEKDRESESLKALLLLHFGEKMFTF